MAGTDLSGAAPPVRSRARTARLCIPWLRSATFRTAVLGHATARPAVFWPVVFWLGAAAATALWAVHTVSDLGTVHMTGTAPMTSVGRLAGLLAGYLVAVQLILMSRVLDTHLVAVWHRRLGGTVFAFLSAHVAFTTVGYAAGGSLAGQTVTFVQSYPWLLAAYAATGLLVMVGLTSIQVIRRRMRYETWYYVHLYAYLGTALALAHTVTISTDITGTAKVPWIALYGTALALAVRRRVVRPIRLAARHGFRVSRIVRETPDVTSIHIGGRRMREFAARPGQFLWLRFLTRDGWWQAHPFSLSAAPDGSGLRVTVKALGDHTRRLQTLTVGTRVVVEGPYGGFTADSRAGERVLMIAAGIGITPIRALLEEMPSGTVVVYRARTEKDVVFRQELDELARIRGARMVYMLGDGRGRRIPEALTAPGLERLVPDIASRDVFLCGPPGLVRRLHAELRKAGVLDRYVHLDPFEL